MRLVAICCAAAAILAFSACGSVAPKPAPTGTQEQFAATAAAAVGIVTDAAVSKLFGTDNNAIAWLPHRYEPGARHDGPPDDLILFSAGTGSDADDPPPAATGSGSLDRTGYPHPAWTSGTVAWAADTNAPTSPAPTALPADWYHITVTFSTATPIVITDENLNTATISTTADLEVYVHDYGRSSDNAGNWNRTVEWYLATATTLPISIDLHSGFTGTYNLTGLRHVKRIINHTKSGTTTITASRSDNVKIDGDYTGLIAAVPALGAADGVANGPARNDRGSTGRFFTKIGCTGTGVAAGHSLEWNRYTTYTIAWGPISYPPASPADFPWNGTASSWNENVWIALDGGTPEGCYSNTDLTTDFAIPENLNNSASAR